MHAIHEWAGANTPIEGAWVFWYTLANTLRDISSIPVTGGFVVSMMQGIDDIF
jgi:hypothetical protein